jgi:CubicO group peptidase (beta-lactamase class C family)
VADRWKPFEDYMAKVMDVYSLPGASVAVARDGKTVYSKGFGWRDREEKLEATPDTVYGIGSITKSFTAVAIMQLEEQGKLGVDDLVVKHLPEFRVGKTDAHNSITIHHFLTHTSGLAPLPSLFGAMAKSMKQDQSVIESPQFEKLKQLDEINSYEELMEFIKNLDIELLGPTGQFFSYSNDGWALLGAIVERVSGIKYEDYVVQNILKPLEMHHSTFDVEKMQSFPEVTMLYISKDEEGKEQVLRSPGWWEAPAMSPAGFLRSTVPDLLKYMEIYRAGGERNGTRILSTRNLRRMLMLHSQPQPNMFYGYGLAVHPNYHGVSLVEHGGGIKGVSAQVTCAPENGITVAVLTNLAGVPSAQMALAALNVEMGLPVETRRFEFKHYGCPRQTLSRYEGMFISGEGAAIEVSAAEDKLEITSEAKKYYARPIGVDMFALRMKEEEMFVRFLTNTRGDVWAVSFGFRIIPKGKGEPQEVAKLVR